MPPGDPAPIRGRWTIWIDRHGRHCDSMRHDARPVEAVPVPDEAAIERGAKALARGFGREDMWGEYAAPALAVLRAALEAPDA